MPARVLVTDGSQRAALAAVRALGREGIEVVVAESSTPNLSSRSRYCSATFTYPSPFEDAGSFTRAIRDGAIRQRIDLIVPITDIASAVLAEQRDQIDSHVRVAVPDVETFWRASDKNTLHQLAESLGVPTPTLRYVDGMGNTEDALSDVTFPCVIKPSRSRRCTSAGWIKTSVMRAGSRAELLNLIRTRSEFQFPFMVQRQVEGEGVGVFALCEHGEPRILFGHRRIREKPPWGGVSVLREAVTPDPLAADYAARLLSALGWHGVAMIEFKRERVGGTPYLMEMNGRFWGSLQLAIDAGINFPLYLVKLYLGEPLPSFPSYRTGVRSRWLLGDVDHLLKRLAGNGTLPSDAPSLQALLLDFVRFFRRDTRYEVESLSDPGPSLHEIRCYARDFMRSFSG